jgi:hypothetical protein
LFVAILPAITNFVLVSKQAAIKDYLIGAASVVLLTLGSFVLFLSNTATVMAIGKAIELEQASQYLYNTKSYKASSLQLLAPDLLLVCAVW